MNIRKILPGVLLIFISVVLSSCAINKLDNSLDYKTDCKTDYKAVGKAPVTSLGKTLGVDEFIDLRPQGTTSDAKKWIGFIPGVLWIDFVSETPDTYTGFSTYNSFPFKASFARAIYNDISRSKLFKQVFYLPENKYVNTELRLEGILRQTTLNECCYFYGSGFYAWFTRIIGLPYISYEVNLDITLRLRRLSDNEIIWIYELKGKREDKYYNIYQLMLGKDDKHILAYNFSKILEEKMPFAMKSLEETLSRHSQ